MTDPGYLTASDMEFEVHSTDGRHRVTARAVWSPTGGADCFGTCTCGGWSAHRLFGHLVREEALAHVRRAT